MTPSNPKTSQDLLEIIAGLHARDVDLDLNRFLTLLDRLGNPHDHLPPVIHVAGTNGKGSTIAFLRASFEAVGYRVHCFTSPHLMTPHDGLVIQDEDITEDALFDLLSEVLRANEDAPLTVFEAISAVAFLAFSRTKAHVVLLETGMGGLLDCTNVVAQPVLTVLTPIAHDHQDFLGKELFQIAAHKAGILKQDVPCVMARQDEAAYGIIREKAKSLNVPLYRQGREWFVKKISDRMVFEGWQGDSAWPLPGLDGDHQVQNAGVALACLEVLKDTFNLPPEAVQNGLQSVYWPGRLQQVDGTEHVPQGWELWIDGGHNEHAAQALKVHFKSWEDKPLYIIVGLLKSKKAKPYLKHIAPHGDAFFTVPIAEMDARKPEKLANLIKEYGGQAQACDSLKKAFKKIQKADPQSPGRVLVCGSFYLLRQFLSDLDR